MAQLCPGVTDPCVIAANVNIDSGTVLDIGTRGLVIGASKTITVQGTGVFTILAGSVTMETSSKIVAGGASGFGGIITILSKGAVQMQASSLVDVQSANGGSFDVTAETGNIVMGGRVQADATTREGIGGDVAFTTLAGDITIAGLGVNVNGGDRFAGGGSLYIDAFGNAILSANVQNRGSDGGTFEMFAGGDATVADGAEINLKALDVEFGDGGDACMEAGGNVEFAGMLLSSGSGDGPENGGGDGGFTDFLATNDIIFSGTITSAASADGSGGDVDFDALNAEITGNMDLTGPGQGDGGNLFVLSTQDVLLAGNIDARAGTSGGSFSFGGSIDVISDGNVTVGPTAILRTTGTFQAGTIDFFGCDVTIQDGAQLESLGPGSPTSGLNTVQASHLVTIGGIAKAATANRVRYRDLAPIIAPQAGTTPGWVVTQNLALPCCSGTVCQSTTTSTTIVVTTTTIATTSSTTPTTSSTTITSTSLPASTTSTSLVSTTTSSTVATSSSTSTSSSTVVTSSSTSSTATTLVTTTTIDGGTTTTTLQLGCSALLGFEAAACELDLLETEVAARTDEDLGGARPARGLRKRIAKSVTFLDRASVETKLKKTRRFVKRSRKKVESFEKKVVRFVDKGKIALGIADELLAQANEARIEIEAIEVGLTQ